jgi:hypothetical protein
MTSYCTVDDVCSAYPGFQRGQQGSVSDAQIQAWVDDRKARLRSCFLQRGIDPDALTLTDDQAAFLRGINAAPVIAQLGDAIQAQQSGASAELSLAGAANRRFEAVLKEIQAGLHDRMFSTVARTADIEPQFGGIGGAETTEGETPEDRDENRSFGKDQVF